MNNFKNFCSDWAFFKGPLENGFSLEAPLVNWENVTIPHTWNDFDMQPGQPMADAYIGEAWYRKHFTLDSLDDDNVVYLICNGIANKSDIWVDGKYVGGNDDGFLPFRIDITHALNKSNEHLIAIKANNSFFLGSALPEVIDWERYGGIYRKIKLEIRSGCHIDSDSIKVYYPSITKSKAIIGLDLCVRECYASNRPLRMKVCLKSSSQQIIDEKEIDFHSKIGVRSIFNEEIFQLISPHLWSPDEPYLYTMQFNLYSQNKIIDSAEIKIGLRTIAFDSQSGFLINGEPLKLLGVNLHQDFTGLGNACSEKIYRKDLQMIKNAGMNFIRTSHYPRENSMLDLCDELGILVMEEQPFWHGSLRTFHGESLINNARRLLHNMVKLHFNHPSIIIWNTVNEIMLTPIKGEPHPDPKVRVKRHRLNEEEWPFALRVIEAMNEELHESDPSRYTCLVVGAGWQTNDLAGTTKFTDIIGYNGGAVNELEDGRTVYDICKEKYPHRVHIMSEGVLNHINCERGDWESEKEIWRTYAMHWSRFYERQWFCGGAMWVYADYSAKGTLRTKGVVDLARLPRESYYFFQSQWSKKPMVHIVGDWSYDPSTSSLKKIIVFSNCLKASLYINNQLISDKIPNFSEWPNLPHPPLEWNINYQPGEIKVIAHFSDHQLIDKKITPKIPKYLNLYGEENEINADGQDICFVRIEVKDQNHNLCTNINEKCDISIIGPGKIAAPQNFQIRGGIGRFVIRSSHMPGTIKVFAKMNGGLEGSTKISANVI